MIRLVFLKSRMAHLADRRAQNVVGDFYVDRSCIDCDTCRWMTPEVFSHEGRQSIVFHQPETGSERLRAMQALLSCPTALIGTVEKPKNIKLAQASFPIRAAENVYHCGIFQLLVILYHQPNDDR